MTVRRALRAGLLATSLAAWPALLAAPAGASPVRELMLSFDSGETLAPGTGAVDTSGRGHNAIVRTGFRGLLRPVLGFGGTSSARFPAPCLLEPCPNAELVVADADGLDPGFAGFSFGAAVLLAPTQTTDGSNIVQKGLNRDPKGQWKLQVDGRAGRPSCVVSGFGSDQTYRRVLVRSGVSIADGRWHRVTCRRTAQEVSIFLDGRRTGRAALTPVRIDTRAAVTIGGKHASSQDNDQFHGELDDVHMELS